MREEKIWMREPAVMAKVSEGGVSDVEDGGGGKEMWVTGELCGVGSRSCEVNVRQYFCSGVRGEGPAGSLTGARGVTSVAIVGA